MFSPVYIVVWFSMVLLHITRSQQCSSYDSLELVSEFKEARQSSLYHENTVAGTAVDGSTIRPCTHTICFIVTNVSFQIENEQTPWWYLDLGTEIVISKIVLFNRVVCCAIRLQGADVRVGNSKDLPFTENTRCGTVVTQNEAENINPIQRYCNPPTGIAGRYVSITKPRVVGILSLCEVKVYKGT
ncbi:pentraxin fusion protein-like [Antedon mediterranea]|uniref:pentraxin fusion protein-like n=1 Tax=Antedon mediterranea TaxID=105859 RepID=UPI003AF9604B